MKRFKNYLLLLLLPMMVSCSHSEYDISEGYNKDITLFEKEIAVPLGSLAPITIGSTLDGVSRIDGLGGLIGQYIKVGDDGNLLMDDKGSVFRINVYELEKRMTDPDVAENWNAGYQSGYIGGIVPMLGYLGLKTTNQKVTFTAANPLWVDVPGTSSASYTDADYTAVPIAELSSFNLPGSKVDQELVSLAVPADVTAAISSIDLENLTLSIPAKPTGKIADDTGNLFFSIDYQYSCNVAVGESFSFPMTDVPIHFDLPVAKYKIKKFQVTLEVENSVPLAVAVNKIQVLKPKADEDDPDEVDDNVKVTADFTLAGGTLEHPATTEFTITIEALTGTLPDIPGLMLDFTLAAQPGLGTATLSAAQSLRIKSSSAKLTGGVTIPLN